MRMKNLGVVYIFSMSLSREIFACALDLPSPKSTPKPHAPARNASRSPFDSCPSKLFAKEINSLWEFTLASPFCLPSGLNPSSKTSF